MLNNYINLFKLLSESFCMHNYLILIAGLPGTGKQTSAEKLAENLENYVLIDQNELRRKAGMRKMPQKQDDINRRIDRMTASYLNKGRGVIILAGHRQVCRRNQLYGVASCCGRNVVTLECFCSEAEAKKRMKKRPKSDGLISKPNEPKVYDRIRDLWEDINIDFKYPGQDFVSYIIYNTEENRIYKNKITEGMSNFVNRIERILLNKL